MKKLMSAQERRNAIAELLYQRRHDKAENLAHEFGVSVRTIKEDFRILMQTHPFYTMQGRYDGGIYVMDGRHAEDRLYFDNAEKSLFDKLVSLSEGKLSAEEIKTIEIMTAKFYQPTEEQLNQGY